MLPSTMEAFIFSFMVRKEGKKMKDLLLINCQRLKDFKKLEEYVYKKKGEHIELNKYEYYTNKYFILAFNKDLEIFRQYYFTSTMIGACICSIGKYFEEVDEFIDYYEREIICNSK